ncbi:hypothetical protein ACFSRY_09645 [Pontibacter locisalis]|uniref:Glycosyltransferase RgtA/B/C/D-like domain-containing protein n=1 Tax=Pontibacter locisalis TaxID=1719035 RepID=A0ABW5IMA6_9BACT
MRRLSKQKNLSATDRVSDLLLFLLYLAVAAAILFRVGIESTGYLSPDSRAYLGLAQSLLDGPGFYTLSEHDNNWRYFTIWPVGYPVLIFILAKASGLTVFWASKVLNLILLGCGFLLLRQTYRPYSFILASVYGAYTFLEVYSFSWSEAPFLLGVLMLAYLTDQVLRKPHSMRLVIYIFFCCLFLFLTRYVGAFSFSIPALLSLHFLYKRQPRVGIVFGTATTLLVIFAASYLYINYKFSGYITGINRLAEETENTTIFLLMLLQGLTNELFIIRKFRSASQPDFLFYLTTAIQLTVLLYIYNSIKKVGDLRYIFNSFSLICFVIAALYFTTILTLRQISHFDDLDYRLLSPASFLVIIALINILVTLPEQHITIVWAKYMVFAFFILSLLLNLPKEYILSHFKQML